MRSLYKLLKAFLKSSFARTQSADIDPTKRLAASTLLLLFIIKIIIILKMLESAHRRLSFQSPAVDRECGD